MDNKFDIYEWAKANQEQLDSYEDDFGANGVDAVMACRSLKEVEAIMGSYILIDEE